MKYAIVCNNIKEKKESLQIGPSFIIGNVPTNSLERNQYTIISYDEAISLGLLGEKKETLFNKEQTKMCDGIDSIVMKVDVQQNGIIRNMKGRFIARLDNEIKYESDHIQGVKESPSEDIVDKIVQEWIGTHGENRAIYWREMEKILKKFLSK